MGSRNGVFSARSAYHLLSNKESSHRLSTASDSRIHDWSMVPADVWKIIWICSTLPKIQRFLWRACVCGLATGDALTRRNVAADPLCGRCGECETISHLLLGCSYARVGEWEEGIPIIDSLVKLCLFFLWLSRTDLVFGHKIWQPNEVICAAVKAFQEFVDIQTTVDTTPSTVSLPQQWIVPPAGYVKCNCDSSLSMDSCKSGIGFICRDHSGAPMVAISDPVSFSDVLVGEATVIRLALLEIISTRYARVMVESDNINLVTYIRDGGGTSPLLI
ncbi:uncharacterized protein LOC122672571 [Telopea speciosissima]|uniref:uncharacterized protein LOC122672571 n=1 Tax=Telopea speciosissima TaxID=54955 RepID=UPI001CC665FC|nr:uncharacterized protein LOC122672571 [Telopea speciosissima]